MQMLEIAECSWLAPQLARWHVAEWGHLYANWSVETAEAEFRSMTVRGAIPTTWVAFDGNSHSATDVLGSVSLITDDELPGFAGTAPWLASLFVVPTARGSGVGAQLVRRVIDHCHATGTDRLFLFTGGQERYYLERGWHVVAPATANGHQVTVMAIATHPHAPRRSVVTGWISDPNTMGAYSYIRPGGSPTDRERLASPIAPGLFIAGEATSSEYPGTMHGAWFSGERAADQVHAVTTVDGPIAIVGAGLAGLAAAERLCNLGHRVTVLEASAGPGGRTRADTSLGFPLHLGAAWMHGDIGHPIANRVTSEPRDWSQTATFAGRHGLLTPAASSHVETLLDVAQRLLATAAVNARADAALGPELARVVPIAATNPDDRSVLACWLRGEYENLYAAPADDLSLRHRAEPYRLPGPDRMVTSNLDTATAEIANDLHTRYNNSVAAITWVQGAWRLTTADGSEDDFSAVVVTVPIGVLKHDQIMFTPTLPDDVLLSIDNLGAGRVAKAFYTFDTPWWQPHPAFWVAADPPAALELWVDVTPLAGRPVLCAFAVGAHAVALEASTEHERIGLAEHLLRSAWRR